MRHRWEISEESRALLPARGESGRLNRRTRCNSGCDDDRDDGDETNSLLRRLEIHETRNRPRAQWSLVVNNQGRRRDGPISHTC
jgi:hypothetical protein